MYNLPSSNLYAYMKPGSSLSAIGFSISNLNKRLVSAERSCLIQSIEKEIFDKCSKN